MELTSKEEANFLAEISPFIEHHLQSIPSEDRDDARQDARIAALLGVRKWDKGTVSVKTYCMTNARNRITDALRQHLARFEHIELSGEDFAFASQSAASPEEIVAAKEEFELLGESARLRMQRKVLGSESLRIEAIDMLNLGFAPRSIERKLGVDRGVVNRWRGEAASPEAKAA